MEMLRIARLQCCSDERAHEPTSKKTGEVGSSRTKKGMSADVLCRRESMNGVESNLPHVNAERRDLHLSALVKRAAHTIPNAHATCEQGWSNVRLGPDLLSPSVCLSSCLVSASWLIATYETPDERELRTTGRRVSVGHYLRPVPSVWRGVHRAFGRVETRKAAA